MGDAAAEAAKHDEVAGLLRDVTHDVAVTHLDVLPLRAASARASV